MWGKENKEKRRRKRVGRKRSRRTGLREKGGVSGTKEGFKWEGEEMPKTGRSDEAQKVGKEKSNGERAKEEKAVGRRVLRAKKRTK